MKLKGMNSKWILGLDISKNSFDACLLSGEGRPRHAVFANNAEGFDQLARWVDNHKVSHPVVGMEATGCYWVEVAQNLYNRGWKVHVLNPAYVKAHGQASGSRTKTDRSDAGLVADYVARHDCLAWQPQPQELKELRELMRLYADATRLRVSAEQLRESLGSATAQKLQEEMAGMLEECAKKILKAARQYAREHPQLQSEVRLLKSIPGIGELTALLLTSEIPRGCSARTVAGWAGVTPRQNESGTSLHSPARVCKQGSVYVRAALYWPAVTALRCSPAMQDFGARLAAAGLTNMQVVGAAMHKLLRWAVGVRNSGRDFDPSLHNAI